MSSSNVIGKPNDEKEFEDRIAVLFRGILNDPGVKGVATRGKDQGGIDLIGHRDQDPFQPVGIQCKNKTTGRPLAPVDAEKDLRRALKTVPQFTELYVVTTASDDIKLDALATRLAQEEAEDGRDVQIRIWGWNELQRRIREDVKALRAFDPTYSPMAEEQLKVGLETQAAVGVLLENTSTIGVELAGFRKEKDRARDALEAQLDDRVDALRDLINAGQPRTALKMLRQFEGSLPPDASSVLKSRTQANIGFALLRLDDQDNAADAFTGAHALDPGTARARSFRVLALLLRRRHQEAFEAARLLLTEDPSDATAAGYLYQVAALSPVEPADPDDIVPAEVKSDQDVASQRLSWLRRWRHSEWLPAARSHLAAFPDLQTAKQSAGDAMLEHALKSHASGSADAQAASRPILEEGAALLQSHWDEIRSHENAATEAWRSVGLNLVTAYRVLRSLDDARRTSEQLLDIAPGLPDVVIAAAQVDVLSGQEADAVEKVGPLPDSANRTMVLGTALAALERWSDLSTLLTDERVLAAEGEQVTTLHLLRLHADLALGRVADPQAALAAAVADHAGDLRVLTGVYELAAEFEPALAEKYGEQARDALNGSSSFMARQALSRVATLNGSWETVIAALDGHTDSRSPLHVIAWLATAFANAPTRPRARQFFEALAEDILKLPRIARLAGAVASHRGDLSIAEEHLRVAFAGEPKDLVSLLMLHQVLIRDDRRSEATALIREADEQSFDAPPLELMRLAMLLRMVGEDDRSLALGFHVASRHRSDEDVVQAYPGLFFHSDSLPETVSRTDPAMLHNWFRLEEVHGEIVEGIVQEETLPDISSFPPDHPISLAIKGRAVGDEVRLYQGFGGEKVYQIKEVVHRYVWLLRDIMARHASRFPHATGMGVMTMRDGDVSPILEFIRSRQDIELGLLDQYRTLKLPLALLADLNRRSVLETSELIVKAGGELVTCLGTEAERKHATMHVRRARGRGAVLDTFTAWHAQQLSLLPAMRQFFGDLAVSRVTIDTLVQLKAETEVNLNREFLTIGFEGEQAVRQLHTPEETAQRVDWLSATIEAIRSSCSVLSIDGSDDLTFAGLEHGQLIQTMLEPVRIAAQRTALLVSDDLHFRQLAEATRQVPGAWLQVVARTLRSDKLIADTDYAHAVVRLSHLRHRHVAIDADVLLTLLTSDRDDAEALFGVAAGCLGGLNADIDSHVDVTAIFAQAAWNELLPDWRTGRAVGTVLASLIRGRDDWPTILSALQLRLRAMRGLDSYGSSRSLDYLDGWVRGHFLT